MKKIPFNELAPEMKTGDIVLFNGQYRGSLLIEFFEQSQWSHVGMVVKLEDIDEPLIWEATSLTNIPDVLYHDQKKGVKLVSLKERMQHYGDELKKYRAGNFAYRKMNLDRTPELNKMFLELVPKLHGIEDPSFLQMVWDVILGRFFHIRVKLDKYFCSELVAETFLKLGFIDDKKPINAYVPVDFSDKGQLHLLKGHLEPEVLIDINHL